MQHGHAAIGRTGVTFAGAERFTVRVVDKALVKRLVWVVVEGRGRGFERLDAVLAGGTRTTVENAKWIEHGQCPCNDKWLVFASTGNITSFG